MQKKFRPWSKSEKLKYSKMFSSNERKAYRKGKKNGFMVGIYADNRTRNKYNKKLKSGSNDNSFISHNYSKSDFENLFDDIDNI